MQQVDWFYGGSEIRTMAETLLKDISMKPIHLRSIPIQSNELSIVELTNAMDGKLVYVALYKDRVVTAQVTNVIADKAAAAQTLVQFSLLNKLRTYPHIRHIVGAGYLNEHVPTCKILVLFENVDDSTIPLHSYLKGDVSWESRVTIAKNLAVVLHELHQRHITHSDLTMTEISLRLEQDSSPVLSENITCDSIVSTADNIYSLGGILLFLILNPSIWARTEPARRLSKMQHIPGMGTDAVGIIGSAPWIRHYIEQLQRSRNTHGLILSGCPARLQQIILWCCEDSPADRPTAADCVSELQSVLSQLVGVGSASLSTSLDDDELLPPPPPPLPYPTTPVLSEAGPAVTTAAAAVESPHPLPPPLVDSDDDEEAVLAISGLGPIWNARRQSALALGPAPAIPQPTTRRASAMALGPPPPVPQGADEVPTGHIAFTPAADSEARGAASVPSARVAEEDEARDEEEVMVVESHRPTFSSVTPKSFGRRVSFLNFPDEDYGKPPVPWGTEGTGQLLELGTDADTSGEAVPPLEEEEEEGERPESSLFPSHSSSVGHGWSNVADCRAGESRQYQEAVGGGEDDAQPLEAASPSWGLTHSSPRNLSSRLDEEGEGDGQLVEMEGDEFREEEEEEEEEEMAGEWSQVDGRHDVFFDTSSSRSTEYELAADTEDDEDGAEERVTVANSDGMEGAAALPPATSQVEDVYVDHSLYSDRDDMNSAMDAAAVAVLQPPWLQTLEDSVLMHPAPHGSFAVETKEPPAIVSVPPPVLSIKSTLQNVQRVLYALLVDLDQDIDGLSRQERPVEMGGDELDLVQQVTSSLEVLRKQVRYIDEELMGNPPVITELEPFEAVDWIDGEATDGIQPPPQTTVMEEERVVEEVVETVEEKVVEEVEEETDGAPLPAVDLSDIPVLEQAGERETERKEREEEVVVVEEVEEVDEPEDLRMSLASASTESVVDQHQASQVEAMEMALLPEPEPVFHPVYEPPEQELTTSPPPALRVSTPTTTPGGLMLVAFAREAASSGLQSVHLKSDHVDLRRHCLWQSDHDPREGCRQMVEAIDMPAPERPSRVEQQHAPQREVEEADSVPGTAEDVSVEADAVAEDLSGPMSEAKNTDPEAAPTTDDDSREIDSGPTAASSAPRSALAAAFSFVPPPSPLLASIPQYAPLQGLRTAPTHWEDDASAQDVPPPSSPDDASVHADRGVVSGDTVAVSPATMARMRLASPQSKLPSGLQCADRFVQQIQQLDRAYHSVQASLSSVYAGQGPSPSPRSVPEASAPHSLSPGPETSLGHSPRPYSSGDGASSVSGASGMYTLRYRPSSSAMAAAPSPQGAWPGAGRSPPATGPGPAWEGVRPSGPGLSPGTVHSPVTRDGLSVDAFTTARYASSTGGQGSPHTPPPASPAAPYTLALQSFASVINRCEAASQRAQRLLHQMDTSLSTGGHGEAQSAAVPSPHTAHVSPQLVLQPLPSSLSSNRSVSSFSSGLRTPTSSGKGTGGGGGGTAGGGRQAARGRAEDGLLPLAARRCSAVWAQRLSTTHTANTSKRK